MRHTPCGYCPPYPRRSGLPSPPGKVSAKQTDAGLGAVAMHRCNRRSSAAPVVADNPVLPNPHCRSGLPSHPGKVSAKQTDEGLGAVAVHR